MKSSNPLELKQQVISPAKVHSEKDFGTFYSTYYDRFVRYAFYYVHVRETAEDMTHDALLYYWKNKDKLPPETDGLSIDESLLFDSKKPYENRDPRLGYTLAVSGSEFLGYQFETHGDSVRCWSYLANARVTNLEATHAYATFTGVCWRKYANIEDKDAVTKCEMNLILIRYAEVLLIYAEAKIKAGQIDASVLDAINKVRQRPSVMMPPITTTDPQKLFYAVCRERKYELSGEGLRLFDIRRWKIAETVMNQNLLGRMKKSYPDNAPRIDEYGTAYYDNIPIAEAGEPADFKMRLVDRRKFNKDRDYLWPIPYIERVTNSELTQNPNYE